MHQNLTITDTFIDTLFTTQHFIDRLHHIYFEMTQYPASEYTFLCTSSNPHQSKSLFADLSKTKTESKKQLLINTKTKRYQQIDQIVTDIGQLLLDNFKQSVYKQTNTFYDNKINILAIMQQIQTIKQQVNKIGQTASFIAISTKNFATQQSLNLNKQDKQPYNHLKKKKTQNSQDSSILIDQSSFDFATYIKPTSQQKPNNFSFMSSFLNENKINQHNQQIINQRINASISRIEGSIEDRIAQVEKEFTNRIQKVMKTIKNLILMINENHGTGIVQPQQIQMENTKISNKYTNKSNNNNDNFQNNSSKKNNAVTSKSSLVRSIHQQNKTQSIDYQLPQNNSTATTTGQQLARKKQGILLHGYKRLSALFGGNGGHCIGGGAV